MKTLLRMQRLKKIHRSFAFLAIGTALLLNTSCDSIPEDYYIFRNKNKGTNNEIYFLWGDSLECGTTVKNDALIFNSIELIFPQDSTTVESHFEYYYDYIEDDLGVVVDSVQKQAHRFKVTEKDPRVEKNKFVYLHLKQNGKTILIDTLYREKVERSVLDLLPLPKTC